MGGGGGRGEGWRLVSTNTEDQFNSDILGNFKKKSMVLRFTYISHYVISLFHKVYCITCFVTYLSCIVIVKNCVHCITLLGYFIYSNMCE